MTNSFTAIWLAFVTAFSGTPSAEVTPPIAVTVPSVPIIGTAPSCTLRWNGNRTIVAEASAGLDYAGTYTLLLKSVGANSIQSRQRGEFNVVAGQAGEIAKARMDIGNQDIVGHLELEGPESLTTCDLENAPNPLFQKTK